MDPNATYKAGFLALTAKLGRVPTTRDPEWLELGNSYSRSYSEEKDARVVEEQKIARATAGRPEQERPSRQPAPQARAMDSEAREELAEAEEATGGPRINAEWEGAESVLSAPVSSPGVSQGLIEGDRGPGGGLVGKCEGCGRLWERPARRGRPSYKCEECR